MAIPDYDKSSGMGWPQPPETPSLSVRLAQAEVARDDVLRQLSDARKGEAAAGRECVRLTSQVSRAQEATAAAEAERDKLVGQVEALRQALAMLTEPTGMLSDESGSFCAFCGEFTPTDANPAHKAWCPVPVARATLAAYAVAKEERG